MIQPPFLKQNDTIGIVSTARSVKYEDIAQAIDLVEASGFRVKLGKSIGLVLHQFAGRDKERARDLEDMLKDDQIKAVWCAKGGYGSVRILDLIDWKLVLQYPKWIIGYSDVTAIHSHVNRLSVMSIHGQMPVGVQYKSTASYRDLILLLRGDFPEYSVAPHPKNIEGKAEAKLIGGNLSVLYSLLGSKSFPSTKEVILFIEDLDEYLYHLDRMMQNLKRNKVFSRLKGLVVGGMSNMKDNTIPFGKTAEEIISEYVEGLGIPVMFGFPSGHLFDNRPLVMGAKVKIKVTQNVATLSF